MKAHEIFRCLSNSEADRFVLAACEDEEIPEKIAGGVITYQQVPLARFARLKDDLRRAYVRRTLRDKRASDLSLFVLSAALTRLQSDLISAFLEETGLPHEGPSLSIDGDIPEPPADKLTAALGAVTKSFPVRDVSIYLHAFAAQPGVTWPLLHERLKTDAALTLQDLAEK